MISKFPDYNLFFERNTGKQWILSNQKSTVKYLQFSEREMLSMRKFSTCFLKPGMKLGQTIYGARGDVLLTAGTVLTEKYIKNLSRLGILDAYIDEGLLKDVLLDEVITRETKTVAVSQIKKIMTESRDKGELVIQPAPLYDTVNDIATQILANEKIMYNLTDLRTQDNYTFEHSVNVCVLSLMTGKSLGYTRDQLLALGVGAILHDLGKVKIPFEILNKPDRLSEEEFSLVMEHTRHGHNMIKALEYLGEVPATIAYQHHENYDGSGYPNGISGHQFNEFAQIAALADRFDALTANRPYRQAFPPYEAYEMCAGAGNYLFKDMFITAFLYNIAAYPTGTLVELNNRMIGVVTETKKGYSLFPKVRILLNEDWTPVRSQFEVPLMDRKEFSITRVFNDLEHRQIMEFITRET
jgi:HD-GYP domain-containing protein (c-di-GMP phosphodiesterase class II)